MHNDDVLTRRLLRFAGVCAICAPLFLALGDMLRDEHGMTFNATLALWISFVFFVPAIWGLTYLAARRGGTTLASIGGVLAFFGAMAGATMQAMFRVWAVLWESGSPQVVEQLRNTFKLVLTTQMIGIAYPVGLLVLVVGLLRSRSAPPAIAASLALGALCFPVARIAGLSAAFILGDLFMCIAFIAIGLRLLAPPQSEQAE